MDTRMEPQRATDRPSRPACLVAGCTCKDARIVSPRRAAFFASWARGHGETADRRIEPDAAWRSLFAPGPVLVRTAVRRGIVDP